MAAAPPRTTPDPGTTTDPAPAGIAPAKAVPAVFAVFALALALRVVHVLGSRASPFFDDPQMDALYHLEWARAFAAGRPFQPAPFFRAPLYPWFLGGQLWLFGDGLLAPRLIQAVLGACSAALITLIAWRAFRDVPLARLGGLCAGLLWATNWVGIFFDGELLLESLAIPLTLLALWQTLRCEGNARARSWGGAGVLWGLSAITRPNVLLVMPCIAVWAWWRARPRPRARWSATLALTAGTLLPIAPITAINLTAGHDRVLIASQAGVNFWIGNNPQSDGSTAIVPGTREDWWGGYHDAIALAELAEGRTLKPSEVSAHYTRKTWAAIRADPERWLGLMLHKVRLLLWNHELGNNEEPRFLFQRFSPLAPLTYLGTALLIGLGGLGMFATRRGALIRLPLWGYLLTYATSVLFFFVNARFRLPLLPVLAIYGGAGCAALVDAWRARQRGRLLFSAAAAIALFTLSSLTPPHVREHSESNGHLMLGGAAARRADWPLAQREFESALQAWPQNSIAARGLGQVRRAQGDPTGAERAFRQALDIRPDDTDSLDALIDVLIETKRFDDALALSEVLSKAAPGSPRGPYARGRAQFGLGQLDAARQSFQEALRAAPTHFGAAYSLGIVEQASGRPREALAAFQAALAGEAPEDRRFWEDAQRRRVQLEAGSQ